jgi:hypothetical protein
MNAGVAKPIPHDLVYSKTRPYQPFPGHRSQRQAAADGGGLTLRCVAASHNHIYHAAPYADQRNGGPTAQGGHCAAHPLRQPAFSVIASAPGGMACHGGGALAFLFAHDLRANAPRLSRGKTAAQFFRIMR